MSYNNKILYVACLFIWIGGMFIGIGLGLSMSPPPKNETVATIYINDNGDMDILAVDNYDSHMVTSTRQLSVFEITN